MNNKETVNPGIGFLPGEAYLANPYVPFQIDNPPKYRKDFAIIRGTVFPGLDLPFMGMVNKIPLSKTPLTNLQQLGFYITELAQYLDTHQDDAEALELYQQYQQAYHDAQAEYQKNCRQISHTTPTTGRNYGWTADPWPWEYAANRRV